MYQTVGNMIDTLAKEFGLQVEIYHGSSIDPASGADHDDYWYVTLRNNETLNDEGWSYSATIWGALDNLVRAKRRGEYLNG